MGWEIISFEGMGPIRFGMSPDEVAALVGPPDRSRRGLRLGAFHEIRGARAPIVRYNQSRVREIEAFYDLGHVTFNGISVFETAGDEVLRQLEALNGGARVSLGIILFDRLGMTLGRLDEQVRTEHSVTAFATGTWDGKTEDFEAISFS